MRRVATLLVMLCSMTASSANTYWVGNTRDTGAGSLRRAINNANSHTGRDKIRFRPAMTGKVIVPQSELPIITDNRTLILGDTDADGKPNVAVNGKKLSAAGSGISIIDARFCTVSGVAVCGFPRRGIYLKNADNCKVYACHVGVNLAGTKAVGNLWADIGLWETDDGLIGGTTSAERNIIGCASAGIRAEGGKRNHICGNYFGLAPDGSTPLGGTGTAVHLQGTTPGDCADNLIGGYTPGERNVIGAVRSALLISQGDSNTFCGNYVGLTADGQSRRTLQVRAVSIGGASTNNVIGGTALAARNVFGAGPGGVELTGAGTKNNKIQGNVFGTNATGSKQFDCGTGVIIYAGAGRQIIGGSTPQAGNYFTTKWQWAIHEGVWLDGGGSGSVIRNNKFGIRPNGKNALPSDVAALIVGEQCRIIENTFAGAKVGIEAKTAGTVVSAFGNKFRGCDRGVWVWADARCYLGNVNNADPDDNGGNIFRPTNTWHIWNDTPNVIKAEGNSFDTTVRLEIDQKMHDNEETPGTGRVDFVPLTGGFIPTGETVSSLHLTGVAASPTANGAGIVFSLSAPADVTVTVVNIAGRPVATVARDRAVQAGTQQVVWSGRTDQGLSAPGGTYLVRITAHGADGQAAQALCALHVRR